MFKRFLLVFIALAGLGAALVSQRPAAYAVRRSSEVRAPVEFVFAQVAELRAWERWSPWEHLDPALVRSYDGPLRGVGAGATWSGNGQVGSGSMRIRELEEGRRVTLDVVTTRPSAARSESELGFAATDQGTRVTWEIRGEHDFLGKVFALTMDLDALLGDELDKGLAQLGAVAEAAARDAAQEAAEEAARAEARRVMELAESDAAAMPADPERDVDAGAAP